MMPLSISKRERDDFGASYFWKKDERRTSRLGPLRPAYSRLLLFPYALPIYNFTIFSLLSLLAIIIFHLVRIYHHTLVNIFIYNKNKG